MKTTKPILSGGLRSRTNRLSTDDVNPMDGLRNLIDLMLIFAVGLLVSLVISQNTQNSPFSKSEANAKNQAANAAMKIQDIKKGQVLKETPQIEKSGGSGYSEMGTVYRDSKTGKLIMIESSAQEDQGLQKFKNTGEAGKATN